MAQAAFEEVVEDFEFLEDWEDRYRMVIEMGKAMAPLPEALKVPATKVEGCASQVWLHPQIEAGVFHFEGDSDAMIVRGLIAVLHKLFERCLCHEPSPAVAPQVGSTGAKVQPRNAALFKFRTMR